MLKVLKNLKNSWKSVVIIVLLLCVQAWADLSLPAYTSKIVNIGIQAGGIENAAPEVISKNDMETLLKLTEKDDQILQYYRTNSSVLTSYEKGVIDKYFGQEKTVEKDSLYILEKCTNSQKAEISKIISDPLMIMSMISTQEAQEQIKTQISAAMPQEQKAMIANLSVQELINKMPEEQIKTMLSQFDTQISQMSDSIKEQSATGYVKQIYKNLGINTDDIQSNYIIRSGLEMLAVALISMISAVIIMLFSSKVAAKLGKNLREKVFKKVLQFSNKEMSEFSTASLITRSTNDIQQIQQLMTMLFRVCIYAPIIGIGGFLRVLTESDNSMAWIIGVAVLAILFIVGTLFVVAMPKFKKLQKLIDKLNLVSREILTGLPVIRAFNKEKTEEERFADANKDLMKTNIFVNRAMSLMMPLLMFVMNAIMILIVWFGGQNVNDGVIQVGDMMAFIQYTMQIVMSFLMISMISIMLPRAAVSANRIMEVLETEPSIKDKEKTKKFDKSKKGLLEFKNVSFKYPDADSEILEDINFTAEPGKTTAIIGSTGSGKSTVVNLIPRFYDVTGGEILVDGVNIKHASQKELRDIIGFVPQKGILLSGTIESNIKYSNPNMDDEQMVKAAQIAQASEFIDSKENKYKDEIAQSGNNVSGGQKQRLSIARAIAKDPEIFVFDDSFSALDFKTDSQLREALAQNTDNKTVIIVAQRISTILNADQIIVLEEGKIVGKGTHKELMKNNEVYRQIALSQLSEEELN